MIIALASAVLAVSPVQLTMPATSCAIMGGAAVASTPAVDYKGVRYNFCCPMCPGAFLKNPDKAITADRNKDKTIGTALFDPVAGVRITKELAKDYADYKGVRYLFLNTNEKAKFTAEPAKFT